MKKVKIVSLLIGVLILFVFLFHNISVAQAGTGTLLAQTNLEDQALQQLRAGAGMGEVEEAPLDPRLMVAIVIRILLAVLGTVFFVLLILSGYWYMTAAGEEEKVKKGMNTAKRAIFGLLIVLMAYSIVNFVISRLETIVN